MKKGFTLAEVLITLTVIGVIAVLTMPSLIANYQTKIMITQLQKVYNQVSNAVLDAMRDEAVTSYSNVPWYGDTTKTLGFLEQYFDVTNTCLPDDYKGCLPDNYTTYDGSFTFPAITAVTGINGGSAAYNPPCAVLKSGITLCNRKNEFVVDVTGPANPNTLGKDLFWFMVRDDGKMITSTNDPARFMKSDPNYAYHAKSFDVYRARYRQEANGDNCFGNSRGIRFNGCLPYIMSHGWKMK